MHVVIQGIRPLFNEIAVKRSIAQSSGDLRDQLIALGYSDQLTKYKEEALHDLRTYAYTFMMNEKKLSNLKDFKVFIDGRNIHKSLETYLKVKKNDLRQAHDARVKFLRLGDRFLSYRKEIL